MRDEIRTERDVKRNCTLHNQLHRQRRHTTLLTGHIIVCSYVRYSYFFLFVLFLARQPPQWALASSFTRFLHHTQRCTTRCRTPLDELSARRRDYLTTHNPPTDRHSCPRRDSNPRSQQARGRRPTPETARLMGPALRTLTLVYFTAFNHLTPNGHYMGRTAQLTSRCCILYIYSTNIHTEYFKQAA